VKPQRAACLLATFLASFLAGCGGGSDVVDEPTPPPPERIDAYAGFYTLTPMPWAPGEGTMVVLANGRVQVDVRNTQTGARNWLSTNVRESFGMLVAHDGLLGYVAPDGTLHNGRGGLGVKEVQLAGQSVWSTTINRVSGAGWATEQPMAFRKQPPVSPGLPQAQLAGPYTSRADNSGGTVTFDGTGTSFSGSHARDCLVMGHIYHYDAASNTFAVTATFSGSGCAAAGVLTAAPIEMLGAVTSGPSLQAWGAGAMLNLAR
jgi:outer membrane protein assembly factor BamB